MRPVNNPQLLERLLCETSFLTLFSFPARQHVQLFSFAAGEYIVREGVRPEYLFYLADGRAKLSLIHPNGKTSLIDFFSAPCFVGEMELIDAQLTPRAVRAIAPCLCLALPVASCQRLLLADTLFLRELCGFLGAKNNRNIIAFTKNQAFPLANRLAAFLLLAAGGGIYREKHTQAAEYLGVSYRHLLYTMAGFAQNGYIAKTRAGYILCGQEALWRLAHEVDPQSFALPRQSPLKK